MIWLTGFFDWVEARTAVPVERLGHWLRPAWLQPAAWVVGLVWFVLMVLVKVRLIGTGVLTSDIAYYENMLYNTGYSFSRGSFEVLLTWHDRLQYSSNTFLTEHFSPTFALLAPAYQLCPRPVFLAVLQPALIVLAGWGLHRLTRHLLAANGVSSGAGLLPLFALAAYLFNYSNVSATVDTIYGFHHDSLIPPLLAWTLVCVLESRWRTALVLFVLFLGMKENLPIITAPFLGLCFIFNRVVPRRKAALGLLLCLVFFVGCFLFEFKTHNRHVGIVYKFLDPAQVMDALDRKDSWTILRFFWPALLSPLFALPALGDLSLQLMGDTTELDWHSYPLMLLGAVAMVATVVNAMAILRRWKFWPLVLCLALMGLVYLPLIAEGVRSYRVIYEGAARIPSFVDPVAVAEFVAVVPKDAKLCVTSDLQVFSAARRKLLWPESVAYANYVLLNRRSPEENRGRSASFMQTFPQADKAGAHFYLDVNVVLSGYGYDENVYTYVDRAVASGHAVLMNSRGNLYLYQMSGELPAPK